MMMEMDDSNIATIGQIERLLSASRGLRLKSASRTEKHNWLDSVLRRFKFHGLGRKQKGLLRRYMQQITGISTAQLTRLIKQHLLTGKLSPAAAGTRSRFPVTYTRQDVELLAETDNLHGRLSGPATRHIFEDELKSGDLRYRRLSGISPSHIYNLRGKAAYKAKALTVSRTKSVQTSIGVRRKPDPEGKPGQLRVDTVHQGDLDGVKGVYHINLVDEVTQWEVLVCVPEINEIMMEGAVGHALTGFPFVLRGFHSDNGGEFLNEKVSELLNNAIIRQTKSRSGRTNDNALIEGKNGSVVRKLMGHWHIERGHAADIDDFYTGWYNTYLNYHRPCGFADITVDDRGRRRRKYKTYHTPYQALLALDNPGQYLREGVTLEDLKMIADAHSHNGFARLMQVAKDRLFKKVLPTGTAAIRKGGLAKELRRSHAG